jgi:hypothetical protein
MSAKLFTMAKKDQKVETALAKAANAILDILAEMPADKARQARAEIKALAFKSCIRVRPTRATNNGC